MLFLAQYIDQFKTSSDPHKNQLANELDTTRRLFDLFRGGNPMGAFGAFVDRYNWLGQIANKQTYGIDQNLARNLPGAMFQDYLINLLISQLQPFPNLEVFTEVRISFGRYPLWKKGSVSYASPAEKSDIAVGYLMQGEKVTKPQAMWPRPVLSKIPSELEVIPLITINSKIRISQSEFFDWLGREQLMGKGNPHCLTIQVALRKEMDFSIVDAAQATDRFFLLGSGGERNVVPDHQELGRLIQEIGQHLTEHMT